MARAVSLSEAMLSAARIGDWTGVASLEGERSQMLEACLTNAETDPATERVMASALEKMIVINDALVSVASDAQAELGSALAKARQGRRAATAYLDAAMN